MTSHHSLQFCFAMFSMLAADTLAQSLESPNSQAFFRDNTFNLPDLSNPKDNYQIIISANSLDAPLKLAFPAGSIGLRVANSLLPTGPWTWRFRLNQDTPPELKTKLPPTTVLSRGELYEGEYIVSWEPVSNAEKYKVTGKARQRDYAAQTPKDAKFSELESTAGHTFQSIPLKPGMEVDLRVAAIDSDGVIVAKSAKRTLNVNTTAFQELKHSGLKLQRSDALSPKEAALPAFFGYLSEQSEGKERESAYQAQFALIWNALKENSWGILSGSIESKVTSSGEKKSTDASILRFGVYKYLESSVGYGTEFTVKAKVEKARKNDVNARALELVVVPIFGPLGKYYELLGNSGPPNLAGNIRTNLSVAPTVLLGADFGKGRSTIDNVHKDETIKRLSATLRLDSESETLALFLGAKNVGFNVERTWWHLPLRQDKNYRVSKFGFSIYFTDEVSLNYSYLIGKEAPTFNYSKTSSFGLGLKF